MNDLIKELREWVGHAVIDGYCSPAGAHKILGIIQDHEKDTEPKEDSLEAWEKESEAFYKATGYLRTGKDPGIIGDTGYRERRDRAWNIWCAGWSYCSEHIHPTPTKPTEPLAVLADRKGMEIAHIKHFSPFPNTWEICLMPKNGSRCEWVGDNWPDFDTYAQAEQAARAYLTALADKRGK